MITCGHCFYEHEDCQVGNFSELDLYSVIGEDSVKKFYCSPICFMKETISKKKLYTKFPEWGNFKKEYRSMNFSEKEYNKLRDTLMKKSIEECDEEFGEFSQ
jgi:hypothetical protein